MAESQKPHTERETEQDLNRMLMEAVAKTAVRLVQRGIADEAWADGTTLRARIGRYTYVMENTAVKGPPGNRERMLDLYAAMVVRNLLRRRIRKDEGDKP